MLNEVNRICRTCLDESGNLSSIYDGYEHRVVEMLEYILDTSLQATNDELPQNVCHQCLMDIRRCYTFKMKCINSFEFLRNLLDKRKEQPEVVMHIKVESGATSNEPQISMQEQTELQPALEMTEEIIKEEPTEHMRLRRKSIVDVPPTSNPCTNSPVVSEHQDHYTVQYSIVELNEVPDLSGELPLPSAPIDVNIRHCGSCGTGFAEETELFKHLENCQISEPTKPSKSSKPSKPSKSEKYRKRKRHMCPYCDKTFPRPCRLRNHLRVHSGPIVNITPTEEAAKPCNKTRHICQHCNKSFSLLDNLQQHMTTHKAENPLKCPYCEQCFKNKFNFNRHLHYHTDPKKHQCKKCDRAFLWLSNLKRHMLGHNACHPYVCELCSKQYAHRYLLQQHILTHNDEKPFKCKFCGNGFTREYNRNVHQQRHE